MTAQRQLFRPALLFAACWLAALPAWSAPLSFRSGDAEIAMEETPYREAKACASEQCRAMRYAILGTVRPHTVLSSLTVRRHGHVYKLPTEGMVDPQLGGGTAPSLRMALGCDEVDNCTVRGVFGDGGATYAAEWIIHKGRATRTVFSNAMDLGQFIGEHLQAPVYR
jgi:hypothetical protein